jgi:hypothetical protein
MPFTTTAAFYLNETGGRYFETMLIGNGTS